MEDGDISFEPRADCTSRRMDDDEEEEDNRDVDDVLDEGGSVALEKFAIGIACVRSIIMIACQYLLTRFDSSVSRPCTVTVIGRIGLSHHKQKVRQPN